MNTSQAGGSVAQDVTIAPQPGQSYSFSVWLRAAPGVNSVSGSVALWGLGGTQENGSTSFTVGQEWTLVTAPLDVQNPGHTSLRAEIYMQTTGANFDADGAQLINAGLQNASFESSSAGWRANNLASAVNLQQYGSSHYPPPFACYDGYGFLEMNTSQAGGSVAQDVTIAPQPGQSYSFSVWLRAAPGVNSVSGSVALWGLGGTQENGSTSFTVGQEWTLVTAPLDVQNPGHTSLRAEIYMQTTGANFDADGATLPLVVPTALVLSGGGAKGDFEVGALTYLYTQQNISPSIICGTSVGAINAAKLAEGSPTSLTELTQFWLQLMQNQDLLLVQDWVLTSPLGPVILSLSNSSSSSGSIGSGPAITLSFWQNFLLALPIAGDVALNVAVGDINKAIEELGTASCNSVYNLNPIMTKLQQQQYLNTTAIAQSGIKLRLGSTCLEDGGLHYVTEAGVLVDDPTVTPIPLATAVLASSSIPAIFPPVAMFNKSWVDGGVRNATPLDAALQLGAYTVYVVVASKPAVDPAPSFISQGIVSIIGRAVLEIMPNALQQYLIDPPPEGVWLIQPSFDVHSPFMVDPGLISISMAYGYMRAAEILAFGSLNNPLSPLSDQIIQARLTCWSLENQAFAAEQYDFIVDHQTNPPPPPGQTLTPSDNGDTFESLRNAKLTVRDLMCQYQNAAGFSPSFLPSTDFRLPSELTQFSFLGAPFNSTGFAAWWMQFERHPYSPPPATPWSSFSDGTGLTVQSVSTAIVTSLLNPCTPVPPFPYPA